MFRIVQGFLMVLLANAVRIGAKAKLSNKQLSGEVHALIDGYMRRAGCNADWAHQQAYADRQLDENKSNVNLMYAEHSLWARANSSTSFFAASAQFMRIGIYSSAKSLGVAPSSDDDAPLLADEDLEFLWGIEGAMAGLTGGGGCLCDLR